jgi:hypothetical protein
MYSSSPNDNNGHPKSTPAMDTPSQHTPQTQECMLDLINTSPTSPSRSHESIVQRRTNPTTRSTNTNIVSQSQQSIIVDLIDPSPISHQTTIGRTSPRRITSTNNSTFNHAILSTPPSIQRNSSTITAGGPFEFLTLSSPLHGTSFHPPNTPSSNTSSNTLVNDTPCSNNTGLISINTTNSPPSSIPHDQYYDINDTCFSRQSPQRTIIDATICTPVVKSPKIGNVKANTSLNATDTKKRINARNVLNDNNKKCKITTSPKTNMLSFLRKASIEKHANELEGNRLSHSNLSKAVYNLWTHKAEASYIPFKSLDEDGTLRNASFPLTSRHFRLFIEDFMMLRKGEKIMCLISKKHPFLTKTNSKKRWMSLIQESLIAKPYKPIQLQRTVFFAFELTVVSNSRCSDFEDSNLTQDEVIHLCSDHGGGGLTCSFNHGQQVLVKFNNFIEHKDSIHFWKDGPSSRYGILWRALRNISDCSRISPIISAYMEEAYGDRAGSLVLLQYHENLMQREDSIEQMKQYKDGQISSQRLIDNFSMDDDDVTFIAFREFLDKLAQDNIMNLYGDWSEFTTPLFTQKQLHEVTTQFKTTLPRYYELINILLNRDVSNMKLSLLNLTLIASNETILYAEI